MERQLAKPEETILSMACVSRGVYRTWRARIEGTGGDGFCAVNWIASRQPL
jgi:hypothetical protein